MPDMPPEPVPTLIELIEIIPSGVGLALELKDDSFLLAERAHQLTELLESMAIKSRSVVLSFNREHLEAIRKADASIPLGWITLSTPYPVTGVQMIGPFWPLLFLNPFFVGWAHRRNQVVCPLDPVPEPRLWYYRLLHCDAVLSDDPGTTCRALGRTRNATP
jgi:glycerophosphoryl diester phosphodiesterase